MVHVSHAHVRASIALPRRKESLDAANTHLMARLEYVNYMNMASLLVSRSDASSQRYHELYLSRNDK
jgi:hypothetical protein